MKKSEAEEYLRADKGAIPNTLRYIIQHLVKDDWEPESLKIEDKPPIKKDENNSGLIFW